MLWLALSVYQTLGDTTTEPIRSTSLSKSPRRSHGRLLFLTISLIAVLIPLLFMADVVGRLFRELRSHFLYATRWAGR